MKNLGLAALMLLAPPAGHAACTVSASGVAFGAYNPFPGAPTDASGSVTLTCSASSGSGAYTIALSIGGGGSFAARQMRGGNANLAYQLYSDAAHTQIWGDGTGGSSIVNGTDLVPNTGGAAIHPIYGRIPARQTVAPGAYSDTIVVTVTY